MPSVKSWISKRQAQVKSIKTLWSNIDYFTQHDQIKFVIMNRTDYEWANAKLSEHNLNKLVDTVWFSPMFNVAEDIDEEVSPDVPVLARELAEWMLADALPVRFQLQLHKIIWADAKGK